MTRPSQVVSEPGGAQVSRPMMERPSQVSQTDSGRNARERAMQANDGNVEEPRRNSLTERRQDEMLSAKGEGDDEWNRRVVMQMRLRVAVVIVGMVLVALLFRAGCSLKTPKSELSELNPVSVEVIADGGTVKAEQTTAVVETQVGVKSEQPADDSSYVVSAWVLVCVVIGFGIIVVIVRGVLMVIHPR